MNIGLLLKGAAMGIAEAIPGVSGGTIAFITGIYEELLDTIKAITPGNIKLIRHDRIGFWKAINGPFLVWLLIGMGGGLITGILVISHLLKHHQSLLWAFFFGLVVASAIFLAKDIRWTVYNILGAVMGALLAYMITNLAPASGSSHPLYLFMAGCMAISALMLPGISGSFILLLLGLYDQIINGLKGIIVNQDFSQLLPIGIFAAGALTGMFSFARIMSFLFKKFPQSTMAIMIGILFGSLGKLWPWKIITQALFKTGNRIVDVNDVKLPDQELYKVVSESLVMPGTYSEYGDPRTVFVLLCMTLGIFAVVIIAKLAKSPSQ